MKNRMNNLLRVLLPLGAALTMSGCESEMGQKLQNAGLNTLMGMGVVFVILVLISFVISSFSLIGKFEEKKAAKNKKEEPKKEVKEVVPVVEEDVTDDLELVAVIAAAIASYEGTSVDGIRVRSIRKVSQAKQWKRG